MNNLKCDVAYYWYVHDFACISMYTINVRQSFCLHDITTRLLHVLYMGEKPHIKSHTFYIKQ